METDDIFERYADNPVQLNLRILEQDEDEEGYVPMVLIEGNGRALKLLSEVLAAMVRNKEDYNMSISPDGAGRIHFDKNSKLGLYVHRLPG